MQSIRVFASLSMACVIGAMCTSLQGDVLRNEDFKLTASDAESGDLFGRHLAVSGNTAVIGAPGDDDNGSQSGSAYVFRFNGANWIQEQKLTASDAASLDVFGGGNYGEAQGVAVSGDTVVVGAPGDDDVWIDSGSAYVFRFDGSAWIQEQKLTASDAAFGEHFGVAVGVSGDTVVVGVEFDEVAGNSPGAAYVYRFDGSAWIQEQKLIGSTRDNNDRFGKTLAVSGDTVVVGARNADDAGPSTGSAYVFRFNGSIWLEEQRLTASDAVFGEHFGRSVAVSGNVVVIGAIEGGDGAGSAYMYRFNGSSWVEEQILTASDGAAGDQYGKSVAVSGNVAVIGAAHSDAAVAQSGSAYLYRYDGSSWVEELKLTASDAVASHWLGESVAVSGDTALATAIRDDHVGPISGAVYVFSALPAGDPIDLLLELIDHVVSLNLQQGIANGLDAKLSAVMQSLTDANENNDVAAVNALEAFINATTAQSGNHIAEDDANALIADAQLVIACLAAE